MESLLQSVRCLLSIPLAAESSRQLVSLLFANVAPWTWHIDRDSRLQYPCRLDIDWDQSLVLPFAASTLVNLEHWSSRDWEVGAFPLPTLLVPSQ